MHSALWYLLWIEFRSSLRSMLGLRRNLKRLGLLLMMMLFFGFFVFSQMSSATNMSAAGRFGPGMPFWALVYLIATWLTASIDRGLVMRPAEIHFVVGGPFPSRDVITLNLVRLVYRAAISALFLGVVGYAYTRSFPASLVGLWLLISVSMLVGMVVSLSARRVHGPWIHSARRLITVATLSVLLLLVYQALEIVRDEQQAVTVSAVAGAAQRTEVGKWLIAPVGWMFAPITNANFWPETAVMLPARLLVISTLIAMVYLLGTDYQEATTARTDLSIARRQASARSGGSEGSAWTRRLSLPIPFRLAGVGTIAWMQMQHSIRILPRYVIFTIAIVGLVLVIPMMVDRQRLLGVNGILWMVGLNSYADFILLLQLPVGFLGPIAQREMLKSLPLPTWAIVLGQLAGPVIPLALLHITILLLFLFLLPDSSWQILMTGLAMIPVAWMLVVNINLLGVWNIVKPRALQQRDALAGGRAMLSVWLYFMLLTPAIMAGAVGGALTRQIIDNEIAAYLMGGALGVSLASLMYVALLAVTFSRWQPSAAEYSDDEVEHDN